MIEGAYPFLVVVACLLLLSLGSFVVYRWMMRASALEAGIIAAVVDAAGAFASRTLGDTKFDQAFANFDFDYSVKSLKLVDQGLERLRAELPGEEEGEKDLSGVEIQALSRLITCAGAYLGEAIRRNSDNEFCWVRFDEISDEAKFVLGGQKSLSNFVVLENKSNGVLSMPMNRIGRFLTNGMEDSTHAFAVHALETKRTTINETGADSERPN